MNTRKLLSIVVVWLMLPMLLHGQDIWNPDSPDEPGIPLTQLELYVSPSDAGSVTGAGWYSPGNLVSISAKAKSNYIFTGWVDADGEIITTSSSFSFSKANNKEIYTALFEYDPFSPTEPIPGEELIYYNLTVEASIGGRASGGGAYQAGNNVYLTCSAETNYEFVNWTNEKGEIVSLVSNFYYTTQAKTETLIANFLYTPTGPDEPDEGVLSRTIIIEGTQGGSCNTGIYKQMQGTDIVLNARANTDYSFKGWYIGDELLSQERIYTFTVGSENVIITARFFFDPISPGEPLSTDANLSIYLMSVITYPGKAVSCPLYLTSTETLNELKFNLTFPIEMLPDWSTIKLGVDVDGLQISVLETDEEGVYNLILNGIEIPAGNHMLFTVEMPIPEEIVYGSAYQTKINQVSITKSNGKVVTSTTRNGRVYVYPLGDTNGDGLVNIMDRINMTTYILSDGEENETFIYEVSDPNEDGLFNIMDCISIITIILNE